MKKPLLFLLLSGCVADVGGLDARGTIETVAGSGTNGLGPEGELATSTPISLPMDVTFGPDGRLYIVDWNNHRVLVIDDDGRVRRVAGDGTMGDAPEGPARDAALSFPSHVRFDPEGRMIVSLWHNSKVGVVNPDSGVMRIACGTGERDFSGDGGPALEAAFDLPAATAFDEQGRLLVMDQQNQRIRRIDELGNVRTVVGPPPDYLHAPPGWVKVCDENGACKVCIEYEADDPDCRHHDVSPYGFAGDGGLALGAFMYQDFGGSAIPSGRMEIGPDGILYFVDVGNHRVRAVDIESDAPTIWTVAGSGTQRCHEGSCWFEGGYAGDGGPATEARFNFPRDVAFDPNGRLYIADAGNHCIRRIDRAGVVSTVAGRCGEKGFEGDGGSAVNALLNRPQGIALDGLGNLYIADTGNHRIRKVTLAN